MALASNRVLEEAGRRSSIEVYEANLSVLNTPIEVGCGVLTSRTAILEASDIMLDV